MQVYTTNISVFVSAIYHHLNTLSNRNTFGSFSFEGWTDSQTDYRTTLDRQPTVDDWDMIEEEISDLNPEGIDGDLCYYDHGVSVNLTILNKDLSKVFQALAEKADELSMPEDASV